MAQIQGFVNGSNNSCVESCKSGTGFRISEGVEFHMYVSQGLCGDASTEFLVETRKAEDLVKAELKKNAEESKDKESKVTEIIPESKDTGIITAIVDGGKRKTTEVDDIPNKRIKTDTSVIRGRERLDLLGIRRTKPGSLSLP